MEQGILIYDHSSGRLDVRFVDGSVYGGLHCGTCLQVHWDGDWRDTRVENRLDADGGDSWYFVGLFNPGEIPINLQVRI